MSKAFNDPVCKESTEAVKPDLFCHLKWKRLALVQSNPKEEAEGAQKVEGLRTILALLGWVCNAEPCVCTHCSCLSLLCLLQWMKLWVEASFPSLLAPSASLISWWAGYLSVRSLENCGSVTHHCSIDQTDIFLSMGLQFLDVGQMGRHI